MDATLPALEARRGLFDALSTLTQLGNLIDITKLPGVLQAGLALFNADLTTKEGAKELVSDALSIVCSVTDLTKSPVDDGLCDMATRVKNDVSALDIVTDIVFAFFGSPVPRASGAPFDLGFDLTTDQVDTLTKAIGARAIDLGQIMALVQLVTQIISLFRRK